MSGDHRCSSPSRLQPHRAGLLLFWMIMGCATPGYSSRTPRALHAMSEGSPFQAEPSGQSLQGYKVPGRATNSQAPWEFFLGNAAHRLIAYMYGVNHPQNEVFYNQVSLFSILSKTDLGDPSQLLQDEALLRPDITDVTLRRIFEIKPWNEAGLLDGSVVIQVYLTALNRAVQKRRAFLGGTDFHGQILIRFAQGQYIWRLEWQTTQPGVVQYRWTRSQQRFASEAEAYRAAQWTELTKQELEEYGGWVAQAVEGMVSRRERLASFSGAVGVAIDIVGTVAVGVFSGALSGRGGSQARPQQPPSQGGAQVIPFPVKSPPPSSQPVPLPAASGK